MSKIETYEHIRVVQRNLVLVANELLNRAMRHDNSKLLPPEAEIFEASTFKLKGLTYGSDEYKQALEELGPALKHHYENNSHHPEFHEMGIRGMGLCDVIEMFCDWCAATLRHSDGSIGKSIRQNQERFKYSDELREILLNTLLELSDKGLECNH